MTIIIIIIIVTRERRRKWGWWRFNGEREKERGREMLRGRRKREWKGLWETKVAIREWWWFVGEGTGGKRQDHKLGGGLCQVFPSGGTWMSWSRIFMSRYNPRGILSTGLLFSAKSLEKIPFLKIKFLFFNLRNEREKFYCFLVVFI